MRQRATAQTSIANRGRASLSAQVAALFAAGGFKGTMVNSVMSTLDVDNLGATPVTALNQTIGRRKDQSGLANNFSQATSTARPLWSARKNRLVMTADLSNAAWTKRGAAASAPAVGPDGMAASASLLTNIGAAAANDVYQLIAGEPASSPMAPGVAIKKVTTTGSLQINNAQNQANGRWTVDLALLGTDWETLTPTHPAVTVATAWSSTATGAAGMQFSSLGGITASFYVGGIGLMRGTDAGRYQRVNTATDYDDAGFPRLALFDLVDDALVASFGAALGTNCTVVRSVPGAGAVILTGQTIGTTYTDAASNHALAIFDGPLNTAQTALVTAWANQAATA